MPPKKSAASTKKPVTRTMHPRKKKSVLVDVIEDEPLPSEPEWPTRDNKPSSVRAKQVSEDLDENLDNQKKFFSELATEIKTKNNKSSREEKVVAKRSLSLYRRFAVKFLILVGILAAAVIYFSFSKLIITITPQGETISDNLLLKVSNANASATSTAATDQENDPREAISGSVKEINAQAEQTYAATGEEFTGEEIVGQVSIINNNNKSQALVATTRILSPDNKLFRIKNAVNVPAGGEVKVDIYADKPSADLAIGPTRFTIPGLWLGLQDKIYAKSDTAFVFQQKIKKYINPSDIERATQDINNLLLQNAQTAAQQLISTNTAANIRWLYTPSGSAVISMDGKAGEAKESFVAKASGKIVAVAFSTDEAAKLAVAKLNLVIPDDKQLANFKPENIDYSLDNYNAATGEATIKADFTGSMILKNNAEIIDRRQLVDLNANQIASYLKNQPEIKDYQLKFSPSFIKKAPSLVDRIIVKIKD